MHLERVYLAYASQSNLFQNAPHWNVAMSLKTKFNNEEALVLKCRNNIRLLQEILMMTLIIIYNCNFLNQICPSPPSTPCQHQGEDG